MTSVTDRRRASVARGGPDASKVLFPGLLAVLLATGWAANHFAGLIPAIPFRWVLSEPLLSE